MQTGFFTEIRAPEDFQPSSDCPRWIPSWWDQDRFGPWNDLKLVKCKIPPSSKSATSPANFHDVVIGFGDQPSDRMGLRPPYDQIYFYHCFRCPSLNGTVSMDRHLAALLVGLSFKANYRSTAKPVNVLNTVAEDSRQTTQALPPTHQSVDIPDHIVRRSRNRRLYRGGEINPLYDLSVPLSAQSTFPPNAPSVAASSSPVPAAYGSPAPTASSSSAPAASSSPSQATSSSPSQGASSSPPLQIVHLLPLPQVFTLPNHHHRILLKLHQEENLKQ